MFRCDRAFIQGSGYIVAIVLLGRGYEIVVSGSWLQWGSR